MVDAGEHSSRADTRMKVDPSETEGRLCCGSGWVTPYIATGARVLREAARECGLLPVVKLIPFATNKTHDSNLTRWESTHRPS